MAAHDIITKVCEPEGIACLYYAFPPPKVREYCTQFGESDLDFITRIASEEGLHYFFAHGEKKTTLVFVSDPSRYEKIPVGPPPKEGRERDG